MLALRLTRLTGSSGRSLFAATSGNPYASNAIAPALVMPTSTECESQASGRAPFLNAFSAQAVGLRLRHSRSWTQLLNSTGREAAGGVSSTSSSCGCWRRALEGTTEELSWAEEYSSGGILSSKKEEALLEGWDRGLAARGRGICRFGTAA